MTWIKGIFQQTITIVFFCALLMPSQAFAATVRMNWNENTDQDLAGYRVYYGTASGAYDFNLDAGNATTVEIGGLNAGSTYYFIVTAYDASGNESAPADEVSVVIPADATTPSGGDTLSATSGSGGGGGGGGCFVVTAVTA